MLIFGLFKNVGRLCVALTLMLFLGGLAGISPVGAAGRTDLPALQQQAEVDLNGNGKPEKITFNTDPKTHKFTITVAGSSQSGDYEPDYGTQRGLPSSRSTRPTNTGKLSSCAQGQATQISIIFLLMMEIG